MKPQLTDVTLRDGLQSEAKSISTDAKVKLFEKLRQCPYARLEITSFVHPKWIPQLADSEAFCKTIFKKSLEGGPALMAFVPNEKGLERLLPFPIAWASAFIATSETFNKKNVNQEISETLEGLKKIITLARSQGRKIRVYLSTAFGCPFEGKISKEKTREVLKQVVALDPDEIALSDTIGVARPADVDWLASESRACFPQERTALHLHNTYGLALACVHQAYRAGIRQFDGTTGGIGGCPYAKGATGNLATDELAYSFREEMELVPEMFAKILAAGDYLQKDLKIQTHSHLMEIRERGGDLYGLG